MIEINQNVKHTSPYLIAKINNARDATMKEFAAPPTTPEEAVDEIIEKESKNNKDGKEKLENETKKDDK